tara:strand:+ start:598 stop:1422 length:825 start_codon:yes stop_codon:yes gene_type:complete
MARFVLKQPIRFNDGTGFTIDNGNANITLTENTNVTFNIGQDVSTDANVEFNQVTSPTINIDDSTTTITSQLISGVTTIDSDFQVTNNFIINQNLNVQGTLTAEEFITELDERTTIFKSGSTAFGDTIDDTHGVTGSLATSGSLILNDYTFDEITNTINDSDSTAIVTENALKNYVTAQASDVQDYLRKSFAHTGSFVSATTQSFTAVTASAPTDLNATSKEDFMFFNNGAFMETDALNIKQSGNQLFLFVDSDSIGYDLSAEDEIVAFGKFNS